MFVVFFIIQKLLLLICSCSHNCHSFPAVFWVLCHAQKDSIFSSSTFIVLLFIFRSSVHLGFIWGHGIRQRIKFKIPLKFTTHSQHYLTTHPVLTDVKCCLCCIRNVHTYQCFLDLPWSNCLFLYLHHAALIIVALQYLW